MSGRHPGRGDMGLVNWGGLVMFSLFFPLKLSFHLWKLPREVEQPFFAHPMCTTDQGPNVQVSQPLLVGKMRRRVPHLFDRIDVRIDFSDSQRLRRQDVKTNTLSGRMEVDGLQKLGSTRGVDVHGPFCWREGKKGDLREAKKCAKEGQFLGVEEKVLRKVQGIDSYWCP